MCCKNCCKCQCNRVSSNGFGRLQIGDVRTLDIGSRGQMNLRRVTVTGFVGGGSGLVRVYVPVRRETRTVHWKELQ